MPADLPDASNWHLPTIATGTALLITWGTLLFRSGQRVSNLENHNKTTTTQLNALKIELKDLRTADTEARKARDQEIKEIRETFEQARRDRDHEIEKINLLLSTTIERIHTRIDTIGKDLHDRIETIGQDIHKLALALERLKDH